MQATLISIGSELVNGSCVDTNSAWLAHQLTLLGVEITSHKTIGDDLGQMVEAIKQASSPNGLVVMTGGLGPTLDDLTREAITAAVSRPLIQDAQALAEVKAYFERRQRTMADTNRRQALRPEGTDSLINRSGSAPGIRCQYGQATLFALPGVPGEMKAMFEEHVKPFVLSQVSGGRTIFHTIHSIGMSEAKVGELLGRLMTRGRNPSVGTTASKTVISIRIVAQGQNESEARRLADQDASEVHRLLGTTIFGEADDTLQAVVGRMLTQSNKTLATAESCTGGLLAKYFTDVPGSSGYFMHGYVTYSNAAKVELLGVPADLIERCGAVSEEVAIAMATECRNRTGTDYALSVTGIAGPTGGTPEKPVGLVYIALADENGSTVKRLLLGDMLNREEIRERTCRAAMNLLRLNLPTSSLPAGF